MSNIILIGFMGAGKSVVGHQLAGKLQMDFLDMDELIERAEQRTISAIFKDKGEEYFRNLESGVIGTLQDYNNFVLSTGGGIVLRAQNVAALKKIGSLVLLWAEPAVIYERIKNEFHRPLLQVKDPKAEIAKILAERKLIYVGAADKLVDTADKMPEKVAEEIIQWVKSK